MRKDTLSASTNSLIIFVENNRNRYKWFKKLYEVMESYRGKGNRRLLAITRKVNGIREIFHREKESFPLFSLVLMRSTPSEKCETIKI